MGRHACKADRVKDRVLVGAGAAAVRVRDECRPTTTLPMRPSAAFLTVAWIRSCTSHYRPASRTYVVLFAKTH